MKERITITLEKELIDQIDKRINGETIKNRSQEIENVLKDDIMKIEISASVMHPQIDFREKKLRFMVNYLGFSSNNTRSFYE